MSASIDVILCAEQCPSIEKWQLAITDHGFALTLDPTLDPIASSGFVPCLFDDSETGFELDVESIRDTAYAESDEGHSIALAERTTCLAFTIPASEDELGIRAAIIAAVTLAHLSDGIVAIDGEVQSLSDPIAWGREAIASI